MIEVFLLKNLTLLLLQDVLEKLNFLHLLVEQIGGVDLPAELGDLSHQALVISAKLDDSVFQALDVWSFVEVEEKRIVHFVKLDDVAEDEVSLVGLHHGLVLAGASLLSFVFDLL